MRKLIIATALAALVATAVTAQDPAPAQDATVNFTAVDTKPTFPKGDDAMWDWLFAHIKYPAEAAKDNAVGVVTVQFVVEKDGSITNPRVVSGVHPALDAEAVRLVTAMPRWTPGVLDDTTVRTVSYLPISFFTSDRLVPKPTKAGKTGKTKRSGSRQRGAQRR